MKTRTIVLAGGTGFLGRMLTAHFCARGDRVIVLARRPQKRSDPLCREVRWDGSSISSWVADLDGSDVLINLAGRTVNCRYAARNRRHIVDSRVQSTKVLGQAIARCVRPPRVWLNSSSATIYRHAEDRAMDELTGEFGDGFSVDVCRAWEREFDAAATPFTRKVALRAAMVMGRGADGPFTMFERLARLRLGGSMGPGTQYVSWLHEYDFCAALEWLIAAGDLCGAFNLASPHPLPNRDFLHEIRQALGISFGLPAPRLLLEIGAFFLRTETELPLKSRRVVPRRLEESGFTFRFPNWPDAVRELLQVQTSAALAPSGHAATSK